MDWKYTGENTTNKIVKNTVEHKSKYTKNAVTKHAKHINKNIKTWRAYWMFDFSNHA